MKNLKTIGIIAIIFIILAGVIYYQNKAIVQKNAKIERMARNMDGLLTENAEYLTLNLTYKEAIKATSLQVDSLANLLKIRPKTIERIVTKTIIQHDTIDRYISVVAKNDTTWSFLDKGDCYVYKGEVILSDKNLSVKRTEFLYLNKLTDVFYWYRKFPIFGKKRYTQETKATCGSSFTKDINIVKK